MRVNDGYFEDAISKGITEVGVGKLSAVSGLPTLALESARQPRQRKCYKLNGFNEETLALSALAINFEVFQKRKHTTHHSAIFATYT